jgi:hypothetical protein
LKKVLKHFNFLLQFTENPPVGGASANDFPDLSLLRLKAEDKSPTKNPAWPQLPQAIANMVNAFAVSNFAVSQLKTKKTFYL